MTDDRKEVATDLALLTMLADRVKAAVEERRALIASTWADKDRVNLELPNPDNPSRPIKVGSVRADGGQGVARVSDPDAWVKWCQQNVPHNVVRQEAGKIGWQLDEASAAALRNAAEVYVQTGRGFGRSDAAAETFLEALELQGYTLTRVHTVPAATIVRPVWETETLKLTQQAGEPVAPGGLIPDGVEFVPPPRTVKPVVTISNKDEAVRDAFVAAHRDRLPAIAGGLTVTIVEEATEDA
jgi:hypothetical protein